MVKFSALPALGIGFLPILLLVSNITPPANADNFADFVDSALAEFGDWLKAGNNSGSPASPFPILFDNIPLVNVSSGGVLGSLSAVFNYSVESSGPSNHTVSPLTSLADRLLGIRVRYDWTHFYGTYELTSGSLCGGSSPISGGGAYELGKDLNFFGTAGLGWTNFTVDSSGFVNLSDSSTRLQRYFLVDENSGMDKLELEGLSAGECQPHVGPSILISLREQLGVSSDTIHPVPLYRQLDAFLREKFAETPVSEM